MTQFYTELTGIIAKEQVLLDEPMKHHTTFRIGGAADYFVSPKDVNQVAQLIEISRNHKIPHFIMGNGSNLLVNDQGFRGMVIDMHKSFCGCVIKGQSLVAEAGMLLPKLANEALKHQLTGLEFASGIPGTVGGAVVMNAGAHGTEMKDRISWVKVIDPQGEVKTLDGRELGFGYRISCIKSCGYTVVAACFLLENGETEAIKSEMEGYLQQRKQKQPLEYPSAGSTFKRPPGHFAAQLIDRAGLRGYQVGGAQVSEKHCGFVINTGNATAEDVMNLCRDVAEQVKDKFEVELEMEVKLLGY